MEAQTKDWKNNLHRHHHHHHHRRHCHQRTFCVPGFGKHMGLLPVNKWSHPLPIGMIPIQCTAVYPKILIDWFDPPLYDVWKKIRFGRGWHPWIETSIIFIYERSLAFTVRNAFLYFSTKLWYLYCSPLAKCLFLPITKSWYLIFRYLAVDFCLITLPKTQTVCLLQGIQVANFSDLNRKMQDNVLLPIKPNNFGDCNLHQTSLKHLDLGDAQITLIPAWYVFIKVIIIDKSNFSWKVLNFLNWQIWIILEGEYLSCLSLLHVYK